MAIDPLTEIVTLLKPSARFSKLVEGRGAWRIHRQATSEPFYCAVLEGQCRVTVDGKPPMSLQPGDFVLVPAMRNLVNESLAPPSNRLIDLPTEVAAGHFCVGRVEQPLNLRMLIGHCTFASPDAALLVSLLPELVLARGEPRLVTLIQLIGDETRAMRPARELVLARMLEVLLIEVLRCGVGTAAAPGLARGLADERLAAALRALHARPEHPWTVAELAVESALSRSAFFARFSRTVGLPPMEYLLCWRIALAKRLLCERELSMNQVAERVGYGSVSTFSVAFARHAGVPPARYARMNQSG